MKKIILAIISVFILFLQNGYCDWTKPEPIGDSKLGGINNEGEDTYSEENCSSLYSDKAGNFYFAFCPADSCDLYLSKGGFDNTDTLKFNKPFKIREGSQGEQYYCPKIIQLAQDHIIVTHAIRHGAWGAVDIIDYPLDETNITCRRVAENPLAGSWPLVNYGTYIDASNMMHIIFGWCDYKLSVNDFDGKWEETGRFRRQQDCIASSSILGGSFIMSSRGPDTSKFNVELFINNDNNPCPKYTSLLEDSLNSDQNRLTASYDCFETSTDKFVLTAVGYKQKEHDHIVLVLYSLTTKMIIWSSDDDDKNKIYVTSEDCYPAIAVSANYKHDDISYAYINAGKIYFCESINNSSNIPNAKEISNEINDFQPHKFISLVYDKNDNPIIIFYSKSEDKIMYTTQVNVAASNKLNLKKESSNNSISDMSTQEIAYSWYMNYKCSLNHSNPVNGWIPEWNYWNGLLDRCVKVINENGPYGGPHNSHKLFIAVHNFMNEVEIGIKNAGGPVPPPIVKGTEFWNKIQNDLRDYRNPNDAGKFDVLRHEEPPVDPDINRTMKI